MDYRIASPSDAPLLARMNLQLIRDERHRNPMEFEQLEQRMTGWLTTGEYQAVLFGEGAEDMGYVLYRQESEWVYIRQLWVREKHRRKGIGRSVIEWMVAHHWQGTPRLRMEALTHNTGGLAFWRAIGFKDYSLTLERKMTKD